MEKSWENWNFQAFENSFIELFRFLLSETKLKFRHFSWIFLAFLRFIIENIANILTVTDFPLIFRFSIFHLTNCNKGKNERFCKSFTIFRYIFLGFLNRLRCHTKTVPTNFQLFKCHKPLTLRVTNDKKAPFFNNFTNVPQVQAAQMLVLKRWNSFLFISDTSEDHQRIIYH